MPASSSETPSPPIARELTARALITGALIGSILAAGNVYIGLKTGFIDGGSITASLLGFGVFAALRRFLGGRLSAHEINIVQATASTAGVMSFVAGLMGPMPALALMGSPPALWVIVVWALLLGMLGTFLGFALRERLIEREALSFPTGAATAEVIETVVADAAEGARRTRLLVVSGPLAALVAWLRDGAHAVLPQTLAPSGQILGLGVDTLTLGVGVSPLLLATGVLMGLHAAASFFLGGLINWTVLAPRLFHAGIVEGTYAAIVAWSLWPALGLLASSTLVPMVFEGRALLRAVRDLRALSQSRPGNGRSGLSRQMVLVFPFILLAAMFVGGVGFDLAPWEVILLAAITLFFGTISGRAAGETDMAPVGAMGMLAQVFFARGQTHSVGAASAVSGAASQVAQSLWCFKISHLLRGNARASLFAQWLGLLVGTAVAVPVYVVVLRTVGLATPALPSVSALSFKATAEALRGGLSQLPPHAPLGLAIGAAVGTLAVLLGRLRPAGLRYLPSPVALALGLISPFSLSATTFLGALLLLALRRWRGVSEGAATAVASGALAGEALTGVGIAVATAFLSR